MTQVEGFVGIGGTVFHHYLLSVWGKLSIGFILDNAFENLQPIGLLYGNVQESFYHVIILYKINMGFQVFPNLSRAFFWGNFGDPGEGKEDKGIIPREFLSGGLKG